MRRGGQPEPISQHVLQQLLLSAWSGQGVYVHLVAAQLARRPDAFCSADCLPGGCLQRAARACLAGVRTCSSSCCPADWVPCMDSRGAGGFSLQLARALMPEHGAHVLVATDQPLESALARFLHLHFGAYVWVNMQHPCRLSQLDHAGLHSRRRPLRQHVAHASVALHCDARLASGNAIRGGPVQGTSHCACGWADTATWPLFSLVGVRRWRDACRRRCLCMWGQWRTCERVADSLIA
jgi:hypothetical protein